MQDCLFSNEGDVVNNGFVEKLRKGSWGILEK